jgi:hypothetical protein
MRTRSIAPPGMALTAADPLAAATGIAAGLVREAVWYRGQCNWVDAGGALGPGLGSGTAGIALFLAQLQDDGARRTARGAIGQALAHAGQAPADGLYAGRPGIAYAAARCGALLGEERLIARAARLARSRPAPAHTRFDLTAGSAGTIVALLALQDERLLPRAARLGDALVAAARRTPHGWCWPVPGRPRDHGLTGTAHGAGGVAHALLELFAAGGDARHRDAALHALAYDGDWPDLGGVDRREPRGSFRSPHPATWECGPPGGALVRLRAAATLQDDSLAAEARTALATTATDAEQALRDHASDFTLARGLAGSADALLLGAAQHPDGAVLARRIGEVAGGRHALSVDGWPCGAPGGGRPPSLLHGHAGIGLFYLRLHDPATPSPLLVTP